MSEYSDWHMIELSKCTEITAEKARNYKQSEIDQLKAEKEKLEIELTRTKQVLNNVIDMERNKVDQLKAQLIEQGQWFNDQSQKVKDLEHWNLKLKAEKAGLEKRIEEITHLATELAEYASYAEIVGAVTHNRSAVRKYCDEIFDFNRKVDDELEDTVRGEHE